MFVISEICGGLSPKKLSRAISRVAENTRSVAAASGVAEKLRRERVAETLRSMCRRKAFLATATSFFGLPDTEYCQLGLLHKVFSGHFSALESCVAVGVSVTVCAKTV